MCRNMKCLSSGHQIVNSTEERQRGEWLSAWNVTRDGMIDNWKNGSLKQQRGLGGDHKKS